MGIKDPLATSFILSLRDAIFINDEDDKNASIKALVQKGVDEECAKSAGFSKLNARGQIKRHIPRPDILTKNIEAVVKAFSSIGAKFLEKPEFINCHENQMAHVKNDCLSDLDGYNYYHLLQKGGEKGKLTLYACERGTPQNENHHLHSAAINKQITNMSFRTYMNKMTDYIFKSNYRNGVKFGLYVNLETFKLKEVEEIW